MLQFTGILIMILAVGLGIIPVAYVAANILNYFGIINVNNLSANIAVELPFNLSWNGNLNVYIMIFLFVFSCLLFKFGYKLNVPKE